VQLELLREETSVEQQRPFYGHRHGRVPSAHDMGAIPRVGGGKSADEAAETGPCKASREPPLTFKGILNKYVAETCLASSISSK